MTSRSATDCAAPGHHAAAGASVRLATAVAAWRDDRLPPAVIATARRFLQDTLGVIAGAADAPGIVAVHARAARWESGGSATALLSGHRCSPPTAALLNGAAAHALDYDDLHDAARVHTNCVVLPAILATAEDVGDVDGRRFLLALAAGAEVHARLGLACVNALAKGWHPTMIEGSLAAALACGLVRGLDATRLNHALGIAYHQACGNVQSIRDGALAKRLGAGFAARNAVLAAALAEDGLTGPTRALEGDAGLFAQYEGADARPAALFAELGERWEVPAYSFKPFPCCRCIHTVLDLAIGLHAQRVRADDVARAEVRMGLVNVQTVGGAYDAARRSVVHAQFNAAYAFARALIDGRAGLAAFRLPAIADAHVAALAARTVVIADDAIPANAIEPARIRLELRDGRVLEAASDRMKGSPDHPMSEREFAAKFEECLAVGCGASAAQAARLRAAIDDLEHAPDAAAALVQAFPADHAAMRVATSAADRRVPSRSAAWQ